MPEIGRNSDAEGLRESTLEVTGYREIQPEGTISSQECKAFWDDVFALDKPGEDIHLNPDDVLAQKEAEKPEKKGGSYGEVFKEGEGERYEVHHMPADSVSDLDRKDGPAIKMEKEDHRLTASCGKSKDAEEYRQMQKELIEEGRFRDALQMDIDDIHDKFGDKYDDAIEEMLEYVDKLEKEGKING